jgi:hypothetical protein
MTRFSVTLILCPRNMASMRALRPCRFGLRRQNLSPDDGQKLAANYPVVLIIRMAGEFSGRDGAMLVAPSSSKEAVAYHVVRKQKKEDCQDDYKQELSNPKPHGSSFFRHRCIQIGFHQSRFRNT